jgi:hypothetical protein
LLLRIFQTGLNSLQKLETRAMRRREASNSFSNSASTDLELEQAHFSQVLNNNSFTVFDTYDAYKVYRNQLMLQRMTGQEVALLIKEEEEDFIINNSELNITCCIMMLDMILKQVKFCFFFNRLILFLLRLKINSLRYKNRLDIVECIIRFQETWCYC